MDDSWRSFIPACFDGYNSDVFNECDDDLLGRATIRYSTAELIEMLPNIGSSKDFKNIYLTTCGENTVCGTPLFGPDYRFNYHITRMKNIEVPRQRVIAIRIGH